MPDHEHIFTPSDKLYYEVCTVCGSYHSRSLMKRELLYEDNYWDERSGHSYIGDQVSNLTVDLENEVSKVDKVLGYIHSVGTLLEIGCAPGVFLNRARMKGHDCWGVEPAWQYIDEVLLISGLPKERIIKGYFPDAELPDIKFNHIIAMDVVEHIEDYRGFMQSVYDKLPEMGKFIMMSPIIKDGKYRERDFTSKEHCWMFEYEYIKDYLCGMYRKVVFDRWRKGHEVFIAIK